MHPVLERYLNLDVAVDALHRDELGQVLKAEERLFAEVARRFPDRRSALLSARGKQQPSHQAQQALIALAAHAAVADLMQDEALGDAMRAAREALLREEASEEEAEQLLASLVLEEAFGYENIEVRFDRAFFAETLDGVAALAALTQERLTSLHGEFMRSARAEEQQAHHDAYEALIRAAWEEGPQPINPEHIEAALETLQSAKPKGISAAGAMRRLLALFHQQGLVGALRLERLLDAVKLWEMENPGGELKPKLLN